MHKYKTIIVWADFMAPGIWIPNTESKFPHATLAISHESLGLSTELSERINSWIDWYWEVYDHPEIFDCGEFNKEGAMIAAELQQFLGKPHEGAPFVLFRPQAPLSPEAMKKHYRGKDG
jgi:hypothetical protein